MLSCRGKSSQTIEIKHQKESQGISGLAHTLQCNNGNPSARPIVFQTLQGMDSCRSRQLALVLECNAKIMLIHDVQACALWEKLWKQVDLNASETRARAACSPLQALAQRLMEQCLCLSGK